MPRKRGSTSSNPEAVPPKKARVRFIFEPDRASPNGITYSWLVHKTYNGKEKAATATRAFWLPFAYQESGDYSEAELRDLAQQSIWQMEAQIQHLREAFGLEAPVRPASRGVALQTEVAQGAIAPSVTGVTPSASSETEASPALFLDRSTVVAEANLLDEFADVV